MGRRLEDVSNEMERRVMTMERGMMTTEMKLRQRESGFLVCLIVTNLKEVNHYE